MKRGTFIRILIMASLYAVLYFFYTLFSLRGSLENFPGDWPSFLFVLAIATPAAFTLYFAIRGLRISLRETESRSLPFLLTSLTSIILVIIFSAGGGISYRFLFFPEILPGELNGMYPGIRLQVLVLAVFTGLVLAVVDNNLYSFRHLQDILLSTKKLQTQQVNLRLDSLKSQISPHFLFNSLNTISSLLYRDLEAAEKFIRNLASVYTSVLDSYEKSLVPLSDELSLVEHYAYLMQVRFEDAFSLETELPEDIHAIHIPPLSLQMLLENAIKHNRMSSDEPLKVSIGLERDYLVVRNNYIGDSVHLRIGDDLYKKPVNSPGIGLENIKNRYRMLGSKPVLISKGEFFTVSLPIILKDEAAVVH